MKRDVIVLSYREMKKYDVDHIIITTSRSTNWSKGLSPFVLGPVKMYYPYTCRNVENGWQFTKLYAKHADSNEDPTDEYWTWAKKGWKDTYAHRYPMGKGYKPLCSIWNGKKLDYIEARKRIYIPLYAKGVYKTDAFHKLKQLYDDGESFALIDFDGYDYLSMNRTLGEVIEDPNRKMGHAFVLAMLLRGDIDIKGKTFQYIGE